MKKKLLSVLLALCMVSGIVVSPVSMENVRAEESTYARFYYEVLENETVEITEYMGNRTKVVIPSELDGKVVTSIGESAFEENEYVTEIEIPNTILSIGNSAFCACSNLEKIDLPESVLSIGESAFFGCSNLVEVIIPDTVTVIEENVFRECSNLTKIEIPDSVTDIGESAFYDCTNLVSVVIPDSVTDIKRSTFYNCGKLENIDISENVTEIDSDAFYGTQWLANKREENPLVVVNGILYDGMTAEGKVTVPESVRVIGDGAFRMNSSLTDIVIPDSVKGVGKDAFCMCQSLISVELPNEITVIENSVFYNCSNLTNVMIPDSVVDIGNWAFYGCNSLTSIAIPDAVAKIGANAFYGTKWLTNKQEDNSLIIVNNILLYGQGLEGDIEIPDTITSIAGTAFTDAVGITSVRIPDSVTSIGDWAFARCTNLESIEIPNTVTEIGQCAFNGCIGLTSVRIPDSVTIIKERTFEGCTNLKSIIIPTSVNVIERWYLTDMDFEIQYEGSKEQWKNIFGNRFTYMLIHCSDGTIGSKNFQYEVLEDNTIKICGYNSSEGVTAYSIPAEIEDMPVTTIEKNAFEDWSQLESITIPKSITSIGRLAFYECNGLKDVYYEGTEEEWKAISIDEHNEALVNATIHYTLQPEIPPVTTPDTENNVKVEDTKEPEITTVALASMTVSTDSTTYTGKFQTPSVIVTDANGQPVDIANYTVTYANNKNVGQATVTVTGTNNYTGTLTATFTILPKGTSLSKITAKKKAFAVKWKKQTKQTTGYQLAYSTNKNFKGAKTITVKKNKTTSATVKKLKAKKKYYVRIRTYKTVKINDKSTKLYSDWSKPKTVKTKK